MAEEQECPWCGLAHEVGPCPSPVVPESDPYPHVEYVRNGDHDRGPYMMMNSGTNFYLLDPRMEEIKIEDIAHHLGRVCRFGGAPDDHYSVAQHCLLCAVYLRDKGESPGVQLAGLLHDAAEAYYGDPISPVKWAKLVEPLRKQAARTQELMFDNWLGDPAIGEDAMVLEADQVLKMAEVRDLFARHSPQWCDYEMASKFENRIIPWDALTSKDRYIRAFWNLMGQLK